MNPQKTARVLKMLAVAVAYDPHCFAELLSGTADSVADMAEMQAKLQAYEEREAEALRVRSKRKHRKR